MDASYYFSTYLAKVSPSTLAKIYLCCKDIDLNFGFEVVCFPERVFVTELAWSDCSGNWEAEKVVLLRI